MLSNAQQFSSATKTLFENQFAAVNALTSNVVESVEKVVALILAVVKASAEDSAAAAKQLFAAKDRQELIALVTEATETVQEQASKATDQFSKVVEKTTYKVAKK